MRLKNSEAICSVAILAGFGEKTPAGNGYNSSYFDHPPVSTTFKGFADALLKCINSYHSDFGAAFVDHSLVEAHAISTQPFAIKFLRELGFQEHEIPKYGKYPHGMHLFSIYPPTLNKTLNKLLKLEGLEKLPEKPNK